MKKNKILIYLLVVLIIVAGYYIFAKQNFLWPFQKITASEVISDLSKEFHQKGYPSEQQNYYSTRSLWWMSDDGLAITIPTSHTFEFEIPNVSTSTDTGIVNSPEIKKVVSVLNSYMLSHGFILETKQAPEANDIHMADVDYTKAYYNADSQIQCRFDTANVIGGPTEDLLFVSNIGCATVTQFNQAYELQAEFLKALPVKTYTTYTVGGKEVEFFEGTSSPCSNNPSIIVVNTQGMGYTDGYVLQKKTTGELVYLGFVGYNMNQYCQAAN